jgi:MEMO1 family protein
MFSGKLEHHDRKAAVAGRFYSEDRKGLEDEVRDYFHESKSLVRPGTIPQAIIVPHAGYVFSGKVAASGFNQIPSDAGIERVFILASSHQMTFPGASVYCSGDYETPLGKVTVDTKTGKALIDKNKLFSCREDAHLYEHSLEVQLPFLQERLGTSFLLVPVIMGTRSAEECYLLAKTLQPFLVPGNLFVISSDFSHYPGYDDAVINDRLTTEAILTGSPEVLLRTLEQSKKKRIAGLATSLCGWTSVLTLLYMTREGAFAYEWIDYQNSGDQPLYGDHDRVVGYSAIAVFDSTGAGFRLDEKEKESLLNIAWESVEYFVRNGRRPVIESDNLKGSLAKTAGAFVSIYISGKLRGCIGSFENEYPLADVVSRSAASASMDHRFAPIEKDELKNMTLEISVLTPLKRVYSKDEIEPGKHGIYIRKGLNSGTFLPQVGQKYGWKVEELLGRCSRDKAGLGWEGWKDSELYIYEAIIIRSDDNIKSDEGGAGCSG